LEIGKIILFDRIPFDIPNESIEFLLSQRQEGSRYHKNISYRPIKGQLRGVRVDSSAQTSKLRAIMKDYSHRVTDFGSRLLSPYASAWSLDFASFRPIEEQGRQLPLHKRNDLLHVDAFPTRPTRGGRILRVFSNISPDKPRVWNIAGPFESLARQYARSAGLDKMALSRNRSWRRHFRGMSHLGAAIDWPGAGRSSYDLFMLRFHDFLKESADFQNDFDKVRIEFPPLSTWLVFTDGVAHAVLSGQFALEHTFIIPPGGLVAPDRSPVRVLESLCGIQLT
jgi:hypothetical protein